MNASAPKRVLDTGEPSVDWGTYVTDEKGRPRQRLVLPLDIMGTSVSQLPSCQAPLPADFALGSFTCLDPSGLGEKALKAGQLDQRCYTDPTFVGRGPLEPLAIEGCRLISLKGYAFDPSLRIDAETRDL